MQSQCNFAIKSQQKCAGTFPFQTLDDLENATRKIPGKHMKISWLILSRVGVHYLSANFNGWTICPVHKKEFLDAWQVPPRCSHPDHNIMDDATPVHLVNIVMSVKILQLESKVVPISSKFCPKCFNNYNAKYSSKPGQKLFVVIPKPKPMASSPFVPEKVPEKTLPPVSAVVPMNIRPRGVLATSEPPRVTNEEITIKTELVIENEFGFGNNNQKLTSPQSTPNEGTQPLQQTPQNQNSVIPVVINTQTTSMSNRPMRSSLKVGAQPVQKQNQNSVIPVVINTKTTAASNPPARPSPNLGAKPSQEKHQQNQNSVVPIIINTKTLSTRNPPPRPSPNPEAQPAQEKQQQNQNTVLPIIINTKTLSTSNPPLRSSRSSGRKTSNRGSKGQGSNPSGDKDDLEEEDILSHDSDDDPSWGPKKDKNKNKESDIVQNFVPRKRKRIGPDDIGVKKSKML